MDRSKVFLVSVLVAYAGVTFPMLYLNAISAESLLEILVVLLAWLIMIFVVTVYTFLIKFGSIKKILLPAADNSQKA